MFLRGILFCLYCSLASISSWGQQGTFFDQVIADKTIDSAIKSLDSSLIVLKKRHDYENYTETYYNYIKWLCRNKFYSQAIENTKKLNLTNNEIFSISLQQKILYFNGFAFHKLRKLDQSITYFSRVTEYNNDHEFEARAYARIALCYWEKNDYLKAIEYYKISYQKFIEKRDLKRAVSSCINISQVYQNLETLDGYKTSVKYLLRADSITKITPINFSKQFYINILIGEAYNQNLTLDISKAAIYFNKALNMAIDRNDSLKIADSYNHLGELYNTTNPTKSIAYQKLSINYNQETDSILKSYNYLNIGYSNTIDHQYQFGIHNIQRALQFLNIDPKEVITSQILNKEIALKEIKDLAIIYLKKGNIQKNNTDLKKAIQTFQLADQLIDLIRIESREFQSKLFWRKQSAEVYGKAIEACYLAEDAEQAFYFMEKNKALLLTEDLKNEQLRQSLYLPDSIADREIDLKKTIYSLKHTTSQDKDSIMITLLAKERELQSLQDSIAMQYESYKTLKTESPILALNEVQNSLTPDMAILMYNIGQYDDYSKITPENGYTPVIPNCAYGVKTHHPAYGLLITQQNVEFFKLEDAENLQQKVQDLVGLMKKPFATSSDREDYTTTAYEVYQNLVPSNIKTLIKGKKLRIIPDNYLHFLPFEALKTSLGVDSNYWVQENEISYAYSNSFLTNIQKTILEKQRSFAGFAPVNFADDELVPLVNSPEELTDSSSYFDATNYLEDQATKARFLKELSQKNIIHLATHADAQDSIAPWIAFREEKLLQDELSLTTTAAQLVVLSGCNTLLGTQETGEGVMSLARGFFHAGAQSVVSSLWSVDDQSTAELMGSFYKNLNTGQSKSASLRKAKLDYLQNHSLSETSPYYWASFVLLGDATALPTTSHTWVWWLFLLVSPLIAYLTYKRNL